MIYKDLKNIYYLYNIMPLYICDVCKFKSSLKGNYNSHLNTLKHRKKMGKL